MQHHPSPAPDVIPTAPTPDFLIISLFALRLARRLIASLDDYPQRFPDLQWLVDFLAAYTDEYALAKITGMRKQAYMHMYPGIVARMKRQHGYPVRFMQMNPDQQMYGARGAGGGNSEVEREREMSDGERIAIIDFSDAAAEWGSTVPIPVSEAPRMMMLAGQRLLADSNKDIDA
ncbi:uncharacterized protein SETTUDRAFT_159129 [Exserohilum turcica Et28A]|uniref:Uncharacterized protein n=1 Tax=Exserohilum turcicum (strain 28A) TaxID=671987 RepID=R0KRX9_EXST2|nr:uncharacterized protein SETTUDRAFT_159129 [Exserohilum turcica Et28A]EOA90557.1 hypothetical protein SETTUDRAFT_159129 [Exserohilum turcica Et28A]